MPQIQPYMYAIPIHYRVQGDHLLAVVLDSLSIFGDNTEASLLDKLRQEGVELASGAFNIRIFARVMQELLGNSASFVFLKILDDSSKTLSLSGDQRTRILGMYQRGSYVEMLQQLFVFAEGVK